MRTDARSFSFRQPALIEGANVIATARPGEDADLVAESGAQHTVDYTGDVATQVREIAPKGVDAVIHLAGDGVALAELVKSADGSHPLWGPERSSFPARVFR